VVAVLIDAVAGDLRRAGVDGGIGVVAVGDAEGVALQVPVVVAVEGNEPGDLRGRGVDVVCGVGGGDRELVDPGARPENDASSRVPPPRGPPSGQSCLDVRTGASHLVHRFTRAWRHVS
jgi:hypothetical protein